MTQYYFDKLWNFFEVLLKCVRLIFAGFVYFKYGGFIMPDQLVKSFGQIMKSQRGKSKNFTSLAFTTYHFTIHQVRGIVAYNMYGLRWSRQALT